MEKNIYELVSLAFSAPFIGLYSFTRVAISDETDIVSWLAGLIGIVIVPLFVPSIYAWRKGFAWDFPDRKTRTMPFAIVVLGYLLTTIFYLYNGIFSLLYIALAYLLNGIASLIINFKTKISLHTLGICGPATALLLLGFIYDSIALYALSTVVALSRYKLGRHTIRQLLLGCIVGVVTTALSYYMALVTVGDWAGSIS